LPKESSLQTIKEMKVIKTSFRRQSLNYGYGMDFRGSAADETAPADRIKPGEVMLSVAVFHPYSVSTNNIVLL